MLDHIGPLYLKHLGNAPILFTGHSLGGAMTLFAALDVKDVIDPD